MDAGRSLISKVIADKALLPVLEARVTLEWFSDGEHSEVWYWVLKYLEDYGECPGQEALEHEFPEYQLVETDEPLNFYIDVLRDAHRYAMLVETLEAVTEPLHEGRSEDAIKSLAVSLENIQREVSPLTDVDITETTSDRLIRYAALANNPGLKGIPTGFPTIDRLTSGFQPEQLITLVGTPKAGKSVIMILMAIAAHAAGYRPMFISFEMSNDEQTARHDAFRARVSWTRLTGGTLKAPEQKRLERMMRGLEAMPSMIFVHDISSTTTVSAIAAKISQHKPDIVFVDGVYLMDTGIKDLDPFTAQGLTSITRSMKRLAQRAEIPIVESTQVLPSKFSKRKGVTLDSIGYCVDEKTEILTDHGWVTYNLLNRGDSVFTLNHRTSLSEWEEVQDVCIFPEQWRILINMKGKTHSSLTTKNHRWPVERKTRQGVIRDWKTTETLNSHDYIPLCAPNSQIPTNPKYTDAFVELLAWFWTEGHINGSHGNVGITQSFSQNIDNVSRIRQCLQRVIGPEHVGEINRAGVPRKGSIPRWRENRRREISEFWLSAGAGRLLLQEAPKKVVRHEFLLALTQAQLELFITTSMLADRNSPASLAQKDRKRSEAFEFACILAGIPTSLRKIPPTMSTPYPMWTVRMKTRRVITPIASAMQGRQFSIKKVLHKGIIWCPQTRNQTWLARRDGSVYFTGNTSSFSQDSDGILGVEDDEEKKEEVQLRGVAGRNFPKNTLIRISWDWETGTMEEIEEVEDEESKFEGDDGR